MSTLVRWPAFVWLVVVAIAWFGFAALIHKRVKRDSDAQWQTNFSTFDRATNVPPDIRIGRK